ncbi:MAG: hypothetical protein ACPGVK_06900 [Halocynthiibacter sp.]
MKLSPLVLLTGFALAGCISIPDSSMTSSNGTPRCDAKTASRFIGKPADQFPTRSIAADRIVIHGPNSVSDKMLDRGRLNIILDENDIITAVNCG